MRVAVLSGGRSSEHEISLASGAAVAEGLASAGHEPVSVEIDRSSGTWSLDGLPVTLTPGRGLLECDVVFPVLHGAFGEDGTVQGLLEILDVPYVGAGVLASAVCMEKVTFKDLMQTMGLPQVDYVALRYGESVDGVAQRLGLPCFVKPSRMGSSVGITKVTTETELESALNVAWEYGPLAIVEAMATGLEIECSVIGNAAPEASEPGEIAIHADWYDYAAKYDPGGMELVVPARISDEARSRVQELAREAFVRVGCAGLARVDFFVTSDDEVLINELNTMPGFTPTSVFGKLWDASGVPYSELLDRLLGLAVERFEAERGYSF